MDNLKRIEKSAKRSVEFIIEGKGITNQDLMIIASNQLKQDLAIADAHQIVLVMAAFN